MKAVTRLVGHVGICTNKALLETTMPLLQVSYLHTRVHKIATQISMAMPKLLNSVNEVK